MSHLEIFRSIKVADLVKDKSALFWVNETTTIAKATEIMKSNNILALPVFDTTSNRFVGIVDSYNIMFFLAFGKFRINRKNPQRVDFAANVEYAEQPVIDLLGTSVESNLVWTFSTEDTVDRVFEPFSKGVHRALVFPPGAENDPAKAKLLTQTDVVRYIQKENAKFGNVLNQTVKDCNLIPANGKVISITEQSSALDGFHRMFVQQVNAVAVVSATGQLIGNLSASDVRGIGADNILTVTKPVLSWKGDTHFKPVTCVATDKLGDVVSRMCSFKVHRLWIVDADSKPIGSVTMSDVMTKFSPHDYRRNF